LVAGWGTASWGQPCPSGAWSVDCAPGYNANCSSSAPYPSTATRTYTACWCLITEPPQSPPCCGYPNNDATAVGYGTGSQAWHNYCKAKAPCNNVDPYGAAGYCDPALKQCSPNCPLGMDVEGSTPAEMPISSAVALIFVAFFIGIVLSYVVYKFRKSNASKKYTQANSAQVLSESSHKSNEDSRLGERPLNIAPLNEQV
jgi:hypothetical protein